MSEVDEVDEWNAELFFLLCQAQDPHKILPRAGVGPQAGMPQRFYQALAISIFIQLVSLHMFVFV